MLLAIVSWFLAMGAVALVCSTAHGQARKFEVKPLNQKIVQDEKVMKRMETAAKAVAQARDLSVVKDINVARYYYESYVPSKISQLDTLFEISPLMTSVRQKMLGAQRANAPGAPQIMGWLYRGLLPIAKGNYHPSARISSILFISRMDAKPANRSQQTPPVLNPQIPIQFLPIYLDSANPDGVRAAALQGIHRYAMYAGPKIQNPQRGQLIGEMKKLLNSDAPDGRDEQAHAYLQRFAVDILRSLRGDTDAELGKTLISISTETKKPNLIALHSAASIGSMAKDLRGNVDKTDKVLNSWTARAMVAFKYEIARLNARQRPKAVPGQPLAADALATTKKDESKTSSTAAGGMGMGEMDMMSEMDMGGAEEEGEMDGGEGDMMEMMGMGMMGMGMSSGATPAKPQPPEVLVSRRKLNHVLQQLHIGVSGSGVTGKPKTPGGLLAAVSEADKSLVEEWLTKMEEVVTALNEPTLDDQEKYLEALDAQAQVLEEMAGDAAEEAMEAGIHLPGIVVPVATEPVVVEKPTAPQLDGSGAPQFPSIDELSE